MVRKATKEDLAGIVAVYEGVHDEEEAGRTTTGWLRGIYPTENTVRAALERDDMYVAEDNGVITAAAIIN